MLLPRPYLDKEHPIYHEADIVLGDGALHAGKRLKADQ